MFKRIEVWILIVLGGAASIWFAFFQTPAGDVPEEPRPAEIAASAPSRIQLLSSQIEPSDDYLILELEITAPNDTGTPIPLEPPFARLLEVDQSEVTPFFLPFMPEPILGDSPARLAYWLPKSATGPFQLHIGEDQLTVEIDAAGTALIAKE